MPRCLGPAAPHCHLFSRSPLPTTPCLCLSLEFGAVRVPRGRLSACRPRVPFRARGTRRSPGLARFEGVRFLPLVLRTHQKRAFRGAMGVLYSPASGPDPWPPCPSSPQVPPWLRGAEREWATELGARRIWGRSGWRVEGRRGKGGGREKGAGGLEFVAWEIEEGKRGVKRVGSGGKPEFVRRESRLG